MIQLPNAVGLKLCQQAIVEETTRNVTLVNCFRRLRVTTFPSPPQQFTVCVHLIDGLGEIEFSLEIHPLSTMHMLDLRKWKANFADPLEDKWVLVNFRNCVFPHPGRYEVALFANGMLTAQCVLEVLGKDQT